MSDDELELAWTETRPPSGRSCWQWAPEDLRDLTRVRREFRARVSEPGDELPALGDDRVEDAVSALDELMSNALRHGRAPVEVEVCAADAGLLLLVGDRAAEDPPRPTAVRDPVDGGMGLGLVATTALSCGWYAEESVKTVWALMPTTPAT